MHLNGWTWGIALGTVGRHGPSLDRLLRHRVGEENDILRYFLWAVFPLLLLAMRNSETDLFRLVPPG